MISVEGGKKSLSDGIYAEVIIIRLVAPFMFKKKYAEARSL